LASCCPTVFKMDIPGAGHFALDERVNLTEVLRDSHFDPLDMQKKYDPVTDWALPPDDVVKAVIAERVIPSTDPVPEKRRKGLSQVPSNERPLLLVGYHQLFGQDLGMIISELLEERGIIARGLTHPLAIGGFANGGPGFGSDEPRVRKQKKRYEFNKEVREERDTIGLLRNV